MAIQMTSKDLIGCYYPVKAAPSGEVVGVLSIKAAYEMENVAGYAVSLISETPSTLILIGYKEASELSKSNNGLPILDVQAG